MKRHRNKKYTEMKALWLLVSVRYAFNQFKFDNHEQRTGTTTCKPTARSKHAHG
jgi:hypothetical protein